ncbi:unnamed protein product [Prorocentrum cordatum]|uniref:Bacterial bifunctional deaminase-reductase C-terminal domain-containing protein n=1 Tax=Prorocentrum cordatum TaxID=2364126 RepID=A0ABN9TAA6_9DINO|nr:unnamed protein product [Polarella glacialis]
MAWSAVVAPSGPQWPAASAASDAAAPARASAERLAAFAESLAPFLAGAGSCPGRSAQPTFKVVPGQGPGDPAGISCDPVEVADALGHEGEPAAEVAREMLEGLALASFDRATQARAVVTAAALLQAAAALLEQGLTPWAVRQALQDAELAAGEALERLAAEQLATELLAGASGGSARGLPRAGSAGLAERGAIGEPLPRACSGSDAEDDIGWFLGEPGPACADGAAQEAALCAPTPTPPGPHPVASGAAQRSEMDDLDDICAELQRRCRSVAAAPDCSRGRHCFVYATVRTRLRPDCTLLRGIVSHVPRECLVASDATLLAERWPPLRRAVFVDADLTVAAYETCAPSRRRPPETFLLAGPAVSVGAAREAAVVQALRRLLAARGTEALLVSGEVAPAVASACRDGGAVLIWGLPARLLAALAQDAGARVLRGLPSIAAGGGPVGERPAWEAGVALRVELRELQPEARRGCFSYPLLGRRQPIIGPPTPVQHGRGGRGSLLGVEGRGGGPRAASISVPAPSRSGFPGTAPWMRAAAWRRSARGVSATTERQRPVSVGSRPWGPAHDAADVDCVPRPRRGGGLLVHRAPRGSLSAHAPAPARRALRPPLRRAARPRGGRRGPVAARRRRLGGGRGRGPGRPGRGRGRGLLAGGRGRPRGRRPVGGARGGPAGFGCRHGPFRGGLPGGGRAGGRGDVARGGPGHRRARGAAAGCRRGAGAPLCRRGGAAARRPGGAASDQSGPRSQKNR